MVRIKKQPLMVRVLSTADSLENRASRRMLKNIRTSTQKEKTKELYPGLKDSDIPMCVTKDGTLRVLRRY